MKQNKPTLSDKILVTKEAFFLDETISNLICLVPNVKQAIQKFSRKYWQNCDNQYMISVWQLDDILKEIFGTKLTELPYKTYTDPKLTSEDSP